MLLKSTIETFAPVPESALRNARVAFLTVSVWPEVAIEPDSSSTSITLIPQRGGRFGFGPGSRDVEGVLVSIEFSAFCVPVQLSSPRAVNPAS